MRAGGKGASLARDFLRCLPKWNASQAMNSASGRVFTYGPLPSKRLELRTAWMTTKHEG